MNHQYEMKYGDVSKFIRKNGFLSSSKEFWNLTSQIGVFGVESRSCGSFHFEESLNVFSVPSIGFPNSWWNELLYIMC